MLTSLLATGAAFGVARLIFQEGHGSGLLGFEPQGFLDAWGPVFFFAMIFAISMDYTVFLLSSAKEHWDKTHDAKEAMVGGVAHSGRVIFAAAGVMVAVFFTFALSGPLPPKEMGDHPRRRRPARRVPRPAAADAGDPADPRPVGVVAAEAAGPDPARRALRTRVMFGRRSVEEINAREASDRFFAGELLLIDVRTHHEFEQVRVPGAVHIPLHEIGSRVAELRTDHAVAFVCRSGHRSKVAARRAAKERPDVLNVTGGMNAWLAAGLPSADCAVSRRDGRSR